MQVLQNIRVLTRQGLAIQGNNQDGNFYQHIGRSAEIDPHIEN